MLLMRTTWLPEERFSIVKNVTLYVVCPVCGALYEPTSFPSTQYVVFGCPYVSDTPSVPITRTPVPASQSGRTARMRGEREGRTSEREPCLDACDARAVPGRVYLCNALVPYPAGLVLHARVGVVDQLSGHGRRPRAFAVVLKREPAPAGRLLGKERKKGGSIYGR